MKKKTTIKYLENMFNKYMIANIILAGIIILFGFILYVFPTVTIKTVSYILALIFIAIGGLSIYSYIKKDCIKLLSFNLIYGLLNIVVGILLVTNPFSIANILAISLGLWLIINGGLKINYGLRLKMINEKAWSLTLVVGIISILFGFLVILNPFAKLFIIEVIGLFLMVYGIIDITNIILLKNRAKNFIKLFK